jgi:hypothetical protein
MPPVGEPPESDKNTHPKTAELWDKPGSLENEHNVAGGADPRQARRLALKIAANAQYGISEKFAGSRERKNDWPGSGFDGSPLHFSARSDVDVSFKCFSPCIQHREIIGAAMPSG